MLAFSALSLTTRLIVIGSVIAALSGAFVWYRGSLIDMGYDRAIAAVAAENKEAVDAVRQKRHELSACYDRGGNWDQSSGLCDR